MTIRRTLAFIALFAAACSSGGGIGANIPKPKLQIISRTNIAEAVGSMATGINVHYEVVITNNAQIPITLTRIDLDAMAGGGFELQSKTRQFDVTIPPGETRSVDFVTAAYIRDPTGNDARTPVAVRAQALFDSAEGKLQSIVQQRVSIFSGD